MISISKLRNNFLYIFLIIFISSLPNIYSQNEICSENTSISFTESNTQWLQFERSTINSFNDLESFTIEFWFKSSVSSHLVNQRIFGSWTFNSTSNSYTELSILDYPNQFFIEIESSTNDLLFHILGSTIRSSTPPSFIWDHFSFTFNSTNLTCSIFRAGRLIDSNIITGSFNSSSISSLNIWPSPSTFDTSTELHLGHFVGSLDDFEFYSTAIEYVIGETEADHTISPKVNSPNYSSSLIAYSSFDNFAFLNSSSASSLTFDHFSSFWFDSNSMNLIDINDSDQWIIESSLACDCLDSQSVYKGSSACVPLSYLPDLVLDGEVLFQTLEFIDYNVGPGSCAAQEGCIGYGIRTVLAFGSHIANVGTADLDLGVPTTSAGFEWSDCHNHWHFGNFITYSIYNNVTGELTPAGGKQTWCIWDHSHYSKYTGPIPPGNRRHTCSNQGLAVGWVDLYSKGLDCQWIDVTDLTPGAYRLKVHTNAEYRIHELDYVNNVQWYDFIMPEPEDIGDIATTGELVDGDSNEDDDSEKGSDTGSSFSLSPAERVLVTATIAMFLAGILLFAAGLRQRSIAKRRLREEEEASATAKKEPTTEQNDSSMTVKPTKLPISPVDTVDVDIEEYNPNASPFQPTSPSTSPLASDRLLRE